MREQKVDLLVANSNAEEYTRSFPVRSDKGENVLKGLKTAIEQAKLDVNVHLTSIIDQKKRSCPSPVAPVCEADE